MIVVTGASKGLGRAICDRLLSSGVEILGLARDVSNVGHWGVGDVELALDTTERVHEAQQFIQASFEAQ